MTGEVINSQGIHDNGVAKLTVGLRSDKFVIERSGNQVTIYDPSTGDSLTLNVKDVVTVDGSFSDLVDRTGFIEDCIADRQFRTVMVDANGVGLATSAGKVLCNTINMT